MDNKQLQTTKGEKTLVTFLAAGIIKGKVIDTTDIDRVGLNMHLQRYKSGDRHPDWGELIKIPSNQRVLAMSKRDMLGTVTAISVALTLAMEALNLKMPMNGTQCVDCAEVIIDTAKEDNIALEDILLFLQQVTRGKYGEMYGTIDQAKIMSWFDIYRDERFEAAKRIRDQQHEQYKLEANDNYYDRQNPTDSSPFGEHLKHFRHKSQQKWDELREQKSRNGRTK